MTGAIGYLANTASHKIIATVKGEASTYYLPGKKTAIGEAYDGEAFSGATKLEYADKYGITQSGMRKGVYASVLTTDGSVFVRINDRLGAADPPLRVIDLTPRAMGYLQGVPYTLTRQGAMNLGVINVTVNFIRRW